MVILVVDDSQSITACLKDALERAGHTVYTASTMRAAMDSLERLPIQAVICDGQIPSYDVSQPAVVWGPDITQFARKSGMRAVLFSAREDLVEAEQQAGGVAVLKPGKGIGKLLDLLDGQP